ncbi:hypothetical protein C6Q21_11445 [Burkholderia multivorans]|uniref:DUF6566 family protein n=1 Tax=Burkholderia multivorans TaxID=87883 RepID=UPI000CFF31C3|nr:DUF6566 family protein [Burkholderia multivorans]MDN7596940.1 hypothetical protein [Burkholderia multivorans]PRG09664.1 hypothetical protein C6Q21_11445 [Burkholderia multivorans]
MHASEWFTGHEIRVEATRNERGASVAHVRIFRDGAPVDLPAPELVTPEWLTCDEALRGGLDQGRIMLKTHDR